MSISKKEAISRTIAHWEKMIKWAKKQPEHYLTSIGAIHNGINQTWYGDYCPLCDKYYKGSKTKLTCKKCPLKIKYGKCGRSKIRNKWHNVSFSYNWKDWVENAEVFLAQLKRLK